ncbi:hypothetical protein VIGAN_04349900, partial [Vigna angularis var. angularis]
NVLIFIVLWYPLCYHFKFENNYQFSINNLICESNYLLMHKLLCRSRTLHLPTNVALPMLLYWKLADTSR